MRALLVFLFLFGCSGWAWTLVPLMTSDNRMHLLRNDPEPINLNPAEPGTWTLVLWMERDEPPTLIEGLVSVNACLAARRRIFGLDGRVPMAKCRLVE